MSAPDGDASRMPTAFTEVLRSAVERVPGARGAVFLDSEGEAVDEYTEASRMGLRITGAHLGVVLQLARERAGVWGSPQELIIEAERGVMLVYALAHGYLVALEAAAGTSLGLMRRELRRAADVLGADL